MANKEIRELEIQTRVVGADKSKRELDALESIKRKSTREAERMAEKLTQKELAESKKRINIMAEEAKATVKYNKMKQTGFIGSPSAPFAKTGTRAVNKLHNRYEFANRPTYRQRTTYSKSSMVGAGAPIVQIGRVSKIFDSVASKEIDYSKFITPEISRTISKKINGVDFEKFMGIRGSMNKSVSSGRIDATTSMFASTPMTEFEKKIQLQRGIWQTEAMRTRGKNSMKAYKDRVRREQEAYRKSKKYIYDSPITFRNDLGNLSQTVTQAIGELTMFAGAITMVGFMASSAFQKIMAVGDMFATTESKFLVGAGYREHLIRRGGVPLVAQFDRATELQSRLTGQNKYTAAQNLARAGNELTSMGGAVSERALSNIAIASAGTAAITGETSDKMMSKILAVAKKGKDADKIGLGQLKLTKNMNENLEIIAKATKENPIARTAINKGTVGTAMTRVRESVGLLAGNVFGLHSQQIRDAFSGVGKAFEQGLGDPEVAKAWSRTLTNLTEMTESVFTPERIKKAAIGASKWGAELVTMGGNLLVGASWFLDNSDTILDAISQFAKVWAMINAIKIGVGLYKLVREMKMFYNAAKTIATTSSASKTVAGTGAKAVGKFGWAGKLALPLSFLLTNKSLGETEDKMLADYNLRKSLEKGGLSVYDQLNLRNGVTPASSALDKSLIDNQQGFGLESVGYKPNPNVNQPMASWQYPNAKFIVVNGDVNMDGSTLSMDDRWMIEGAGTI